MNAMIVCWKAERTWIPGVEVPRTLVENPSLRVLQNGIHLAQDQHKECRWPLASPHGQVVVRWGREGVKRFSLEGCLLFKLEQNGQRDYGCLVEVLSAGAYLAIVPDSWERDEELSGDSPVMPESTSLRGYRAHFFYLDGPDNKIAFRKPNGKLFVRPLG